MKKAFALMSILGLLAFTNLNGLMAQEATAPVEAPAAEQVDEQTTDSAAPAEAVEAEEAETVAAAPAEKDTFHQVLKKKFIEGGAGWMTPVLLCLILGLALVIERILYLNMSSTNVTKLLNGIEDNVKNGNYEGAKELCRNTRGPVASIFYQGLDRIDTGLENVEKSITSYGGVQMARLEANMTWIAMFIALAPSFGFLGTTIGMVAAFDAIEAAGDISPTVVAGGMKVALLTTIFGLIVAIILQIFYNYLLTKIESLVSDMEEGSISFMDILVKYHK
ncbi:MAG: MotA/TolQ/ExbB proton channel family protein [Bacteroidales bacterium]|nr:MotA/TolQ/ExbB proton channel family protein [Bacteroidales bacterium]